MADLGSIATNGDETKRAFVGNPALQPSGLAWSGDETKRIPLVGNPAMRLQSMVAGNERLVLGGEDFTQGNPDQPCLRMDASGVWRFRWAMAVGSHTISVRVLHAINQNPRPSLVVKSNTAIGINSDIETFAAAGTDWVTISSPTFVTTTIGVTWVELRNNLITNVGFSPCYFDHLSKT